MVLLPLPLLLLLPKLIPPGALHLPLLVHLEGLVLGLLLVSILSLPPPVKLCLLVLEQLLVLLHDALLLELLLLHLQLQVPPHLLLLRARELAVLLLLLVFHLLGVLGNLRPLAKLLRRRLRHCRQRLRVQWPALRGPSGRQRPQQRVELRVALPRGLPRGLRRLLPSGRAPRELRDGPGALAPRAQGARAGRPEDPLFQPLEVGV
mmetsp:Transcript_53976/g.157560  ORF Transcript_53976/g.157560 Transcript_53976/m.157560 type:complete len:206 (+) Transcript_53976:906-1523(+)